MPDENTQPVGLGVGEPVWRATDAGGSFYFDADTRSGFDPASIDFDTPGKWFPTDAESLAQMRERLTHYFATAFTDVLYPEIHADAVMRLLFGDAT
jgi:hypothetical protein